MDIHFRLIASLLNEYIDLKKKYLDFQHKDIEEIELKIIEAFKALDKNCSKETQFKEYFIMDSFEFLNHQIQIFKELVKLINFLKVIIK